MSLNAIIEKKKNQVKLTGKRGRSVKEIAQESSCWRKTVTNEEMDRYLQFVDWDQNNF